MLWRRPGRSGVPLGWCLTLFCEIERKIVLRDDEASLVLRGWDLVVVGKLSFVFQRILGDFVGSLGAVGPPLGVRLGSSRVSRVLQGF